MEINRREAMTTGAAALLAMAAGPLLGGDDLPDEEESSTSVSSSGCDGIPVHVSLHGPGIRWEWDLDPRCRVVATLRDAIYAPRRKSYHFTFSPPLAGFRREILSLRRSPDSDFVDLLVQDRSIVSIILNPKTATWHV